MAGRVQVKDLQSPEPLRTAARPVDTTVVQPRASKDNTLLSLAGALKELNPALNRYFADEMQQFEQTEEKRAREKLAGLTLEETQALVKSGTLAEAESPHFVRSFNKLAGMNAMKLASREWEQEFKNNFGEVGPNLETWLQEKRKSMLEGVDNEQFTGAFDNEFLKVREGMFDLRNKLNGEQVRENKFTEVLQGMDNDIQAMLKGKASPAQIAENLRHWYPLNKSAFGLSHGDTDELVLRLAQKYANDGRTDLVKALLDTDRQDETGQVIPSISKKHKLGGEAQRLIAHSDVVKDRKEAEYRRDLNYATAGQQARFQFLANQGQLNVKEMLDWNEKHGRVLSADSVQALQAANLMGIQREKDRIAKEEAELKPVLAAVELGRQGLLFHVTDDKVKNKAVTATLEILKQQFPDPEQRFQAELDYFSKNGEKHPVWDEALKKGFVAGSTASVDDTTLPPAFEAGQSLYETMKAKGISTAAYLSQDQEVFYATVQVLKETGSDPRQAYAQARELLGDKEKYQTFLNSEKAKQIRSVTQSQFDGLFTTPPANIGVVSQKVERLAMIFGQVMSPEDAFKKAAKIVSDNSVVVNGLSIRKTPNIENLDFDAATSKALDNFIAKHPEYSKDDLIIRPYSPGNDVWVIAEKGGINRPILKGADTFLRVGDLRGLAAQSAVDDVNKAGERRKIIQQEKLDTPFEEQQFNQRARGF